MSVTPQGYPDWMVPQPNSVLPLLNQQYNPGASSILFPAFRTTGFNILYVAWTNSNISGSDCYLIVSQNNGIAGDFKVLFTRFFTCAIGSSAIIAVPVTAGSCTMQVQGMGVGQIQGAITVVGANGSVKHDAQLGVRVVEVQTALPVPAVTTTSVFPQTVVEGPATFCMNGQPLGVVANVFALDFSAVYKFLTQVAPQGVNAPAVTELWLPPRQLRIDYVNPTAGALNISSSLVSGG